MARQASRAFNAVMRVATRLITLPMIATVEGISQVPISRYYSK
jgi:hypothetical protein